MKNLFVYTADKLRKAGNIAIIKKNNAWYFKILFQFLKIKLMSFT